jgi:hypothetical protein
MAMADAVMEWIIVYNEKLSFGKRMCTWVQMNRVND